VNELDEDYENVRAAVEWAAEPEPCAALRLLGPAYEEAGLSFANVQRTTFDVDMLIAGDLTGAPQPA
jgi:hypothetical protein